MVYQAVVNGDNISRGKVILGALDLYSDNEYYSNSTVYFDENNHEIYVSYCSNENRIKPYKTVKTNWIDSKQNKKQAMYVKEYDEDNNFKCTYYGKTLYERDNAGKLICTLIYYKSDNNKKYNLDTLSFSQYDSYGNRSGAVEYELKYDENEKKNKRILKSKTLYSQYDNKGQFHKKLIYNSDNQLVEELTFEFYPNGKLVKTQNDKYYKYNQLVSDITTNYTYNDNGRIIEKIDTGIEQADSFVPVRNDLSDEENEKNIKESYYGKNLKLKSVNRKWSFSYDNQNREVYRCFYDEEFNKNYKPLSGMDIPPSCGRDASYKDNEKGDWIEMVMYDNLDKPSKIVVRKIEYY